MDHFRELAEHVYLLTPDKWLLRLPRVPVLQPELESQGFSPVQYIGNLNLPGDWDTAGTQGELPSRHPIYNTGDGVAFVPVAPGEFQASYPLFGTEEPPAVPERVFLVCASPRWFADMNTLRRLALQSETTAPVDHPNPPNPVEHRRDVTLSLDECALALFLADKTRSKKAIAELLGIPTQSICPSRCPNLDQTMKAWRSANVGRRVHGSKRKDGTLEAWPDENE